MNRAIASLLIAFTLLVSHSARADEISFTSSKTRNTLLELYTSEGCSSCPPADKWLNTLKQDPRLWKTLFPIAFHVDYWNYLGWKDPFSESSYSARQRSYAAHGYADTVYTPGFFQNGREWRGWFRKPTLNREQRLETGVLKVSIKPDSLSAEFNPTFPLSNATLNLAVLGMDKVTQVKAGENRNHELHHNFVALYFTQIFGNDHQWEITDKALLRKLNWGEAVVVWVTEGNNPTPVQTTGGWLAVK